MNAGLVGLLKTTTLLRSEQTFLPLVGGRLGPLAGEVRAEMGDGKE